MAVFGFSPQQQEDAFLKNNIRKDAEEFQKYVMKEAIQSIRHGIQDQKITTGRVLQIISSVLTQ